MSFPSPQLVRSPLVSGPVARGEKAAASASCWVGGVRELWKDPSVRSKPRGYDEKRQYDGGSLRLHETMVAL